MVAVVPRQVGALPGMLGVLPRMVGVVPRMVGVAPSMANRLLPQAVSSGGSGAGRAIEANRQPTGKAKPEHRQDRPRCAVQSLAPDCRDRKRLGPEVPARPSRQLVRCPKGPEGGPGWPAEVQGWRLATERTNRATDFADGSGPLCGSRFRSSDRRLPATQGLEAVRRRMGSAGGRTSHGDEGVHPPGG